MRRVAVTGLGLVNPFGGQDVNAFFESLLQGRSAVTTREWSPTDRPLITPFVSCSAFVGEEVLGKPLASMMDRFCQLGIGAAFAAWEDAGLTRKPAEGQGRDRWGVSWGTALGGIMAHDRYYEASFLRGRERASPLSVLMGMNNAVPAHASIQLGLGGMSSTHSDACASSAMAIGEAFQQIRTGQADVVLAGGSETPQAYAVMRAWESLRVLAAVPESGGAASACRPFARGRDGLVLGEGAAALVLEDWEHARQRGATIIAELAGFGASSDHSHLVRPSADGQVRALRAALADAQMSVADIGYVNAHGTATIEGDVAEVKALARVFGEGAAALPVSSSKSMHGHLLGAAGAMEALVTVQALKHRVLPPTAHLAGRHDDACHCVDLFTEAREARDIGAAVSSSFAFGGGNAVLVFRQTRD
ncbi:beta-ketoacyl-ACP synthase II [Hydrogenophaga sp. 5NK40-0174]